MEAVKVIIFSGRGVRSSIASPKKIIIPIYNIRHSVDPRKKIPRYPKNKFKAPDRVSYPYAPHPTDRKPGFTSSDHI